MPLSDLVEIILLFLLAQGKQLQQCDTRIVVVEVCPLWIMADRYAACLFKNILIFFVVQNQRL